MAFFKRIFTSVSTILSLLAAVLQLLGVASVFTALKSLAAAELPAPYVYGGLALLCIVAVGLIWVMIASIIEAVSRPRRPFDITDESFHFKLAARQCTHTSKFTIKSRAPGNWAFPYRYYWSGSTKPTLDVISPPGAVFMETGREQHWTIGQVVFPVTFTRTAGDEVVVEIETTSTDVDYQSFVSRIPQERVNSLTLQVTSDVALNEVAQLVLETPHDAATKGLVPFDEPAAPIKNHHSWVIKSPKLGKQYMLAWT